METMPEELALKKIEMNKAFDIYEILDSFKFRFTKDEMDKK